MSVSFVIHHDPAGINKRDIIPADSGVNLLDWLIDNYGITGFAVPTTINVLEEEIDLDSFDSMNRILVDGDIVTIVHRPQEASTAIVILSVVLAFVLTTDISPPPTPDNPNFPRSNESPNNQLSGQTNIARLMGRIPDIYGRMRVFPDLGSGSVTEYISHVKHVTEYLIIGRGEYDLSEIKSGNTLISDIVGTNITVYEPNDIIPELITPFESNEVNGQELKAINQLNVFDFTVDDVSFYNNQSFLSTDSEMSNFQTIDQGREFTITGTVSNDGTYTFDRVDVISDPENNGGNTIYRVFVDESITPESSVDNIQFENVSSGVEVGAYVVPDRPDEIWLDLVCQRGLIDRRFSPSTEVQVPFMATLEELNVNGVVIDTDEREFTLTGQSIDERFFTVKLIPKNPRSRYRITMERLSSSIDDNAYYDTFKWEKLTSIRRIENFDQGNVTSIVLTTQATVSATRGQERKFNAIAHRKLRTYDTVTDQIVNTLSATSRMADAMLHHLTDPLIGNKDPSSIDLDGLYAIQESIEGDINYGDDLGKFCHSFSGDKVSVKDEIITIANACRCFVIKNGDRFEFGIDREKPLRTSLFSARNKKPKSEKKNVRMQRKSDNDGVELQWTDEDEGDTYTIKLPDEFALNPKKIEATGIRNYKQAWNRASIEFEKIKRNRESVKFDATKDALFIRAGDRVANADGTDIKSQSGEIRSVDGFNVETYTPIDFGGNLNAVVIIKSSSGIASDEITVTPRVDGVYGFILGVMPAFPITVRGDNDYQVGSVYTLSLTGETRIKDYIVQKISPKGDYVSVELSNYDPEVYAVDTQSPPQHETTIQSVEVSMVQDGSIVFEPDVTLSPVAAEVLALTNDPDGNAYEAYGLVEGVIRFVVDTLGGWLIGGGGNFVLDTADGLYRAGLSGIDITNYEIRISHSINNPVTSTGSVIYLGGASDGVWVDLTGSQGVELQADPSENVDADITVEIREKGNIINTTGAFTFNLTAEADPPI